MTAADVLCWAAKVARTDDTPNLKDLKEIIAHVKPHVLIGLTGGGPAFDEVQPAPMALVHAGILCSPAYMGSCPQQLLALTSCSTHLFSLVMCPAHAVPLCRA